MSEIAGAATVDILLADFANSDAVGKGNIVGSGLAVLGLDQQGLTARFSLIVLVHLPDAHLPSEFPLEIALLDDAGQIISIPGAVPGEPQMLRIAQIVTMEKPSLPMLPIAARIRLGARHQSVIDFANGLQLTPGVYSWRVLLDGDESVEWRYNFAVPGPSSGLVVG